MKIKKFQGRSFKEVLEMVKKEMGPDAVILSSSTKKDILSGGSYIEITAAVDEAEQDLPIGGSVTIDATDTGVFKEIEKIKIEVALLRESFTKLFPSFNDSSKSSLYNFLIKSGVEPYLALELVENSKDMDELRKSIEQKIKKTHKSFNDERGFIFYGLPGVGKTTTIFKIGQALRASNEKIMVLSLDQRISSVAYIKEVALKLKCEAKFVRDHRELYRTIHKEIDRARLLIDTPGDAHINEATRLKELLKDLPVRKCFLIDASMATQSSFKALKSVDSNAIDCIGFSKLDLAYNYGNLYNLSVVTGKPVSFLTSGAYGDMNCQIFPPDSITNFVVGGACEN